MIVDAIKVLQKEVAVHFGLILSFREATSLYVISDPPVILHDIPMLT